MRNECQINTQRHSVPHFKDTAGYRRKHLVAASVAMPRQKFCSVPGCMSTTEMVKKEQEAFLARFCGLCRSSRPCRCPAPEIYTTRKETKPKFASWCSAIGLKDPGYYVNVCHKHFSEGCPTKSCPDPDVFIPVQENQIAQLPVQIGKIAHACGQDTSELQQGMAHPIMVAKRPPAHVQLPRYPLLQGQLEKELLEKLKPCPISPQLLPATQPTARSCSTSSSMSSASSEGGRDEDEREMSQKPPPHLCQFLSSLITYQKSNPHCLVTFSTPANLPKTPLSQSDLRMKPAVCSGDEIHRQQLPDELRNDYREPATGRAGQSLAPDVFARKQEANWSDMEISSTTDIMSGSGDFEDMFLQCNEELTGTDDSSLSSEAAIRDLPDVLMDPSEDPYLNEGTAILSQQGKCHAVFSHFSTDEPESMNRWLEVGDP